MSKLTKIQGEELEAQQKEMYFERKLNMLPTTIREVYSSIGGVDTLVARELHGENNKLVLGISYANGVPVEAYTTDTNGKRIPFVPVKSVENTEQMSAVQTLIAERLERIAENGEIKSQPKPKVRRVVPKKKEEKIQKNLVAAVVGNKRETH